jgi:hypothetical protein
MGAPVRKVDEREGVLLDRPHDKGLGLVEESMVQGPMRHAIILDHMYDRV